jgi:hypothetical protein
MVLFLALALLGAVLPTATAGHWPAVIEQADNYGRNNFQATFRPLPGECPRGF